MIKKYFPILILSAVCLAACSKKEEEVTAESSAPVMAVVNEVPSAEAQEPMRDPLKNIVTNTNNTFDAAQNQNIVGNTPANETQVQPNSSVQDAHFVNPMDRVVVNGQAAAMAPDNSNIKVTRTPDGGYAATAAAPTLKPQAASAGSGDGRTL